MLPKCFPLRSIRIQPEHRNDVVKNVNFVFVLPLLVQVSFSKMSSQMAHLVYPWTLPSFHWTWLLEQSPGWSEFAVWCKTGSRQHWSGHTCWLLLYDSRSWSWDRLQEWQCRWTGCGGGAGSCLQTCPFGGRWPPYRRRCEGPPPWWQLLMRPQLVTAADHSRQHLPAWNGARDFPYFFNSLDLNQWYDEYAVYDGYRLQL